MSRLMSRRLVNLQPKFPIISFSFDDFPQSAARAAGTILEEKGFRGTYYASLGLVDSALPAGRGFSIQDLRRVVAEGHELGCHTFHHCHSWETEPNKFEASILQNKKALGELLSAAEFETLSYPIACPRPGNKERAAKYFPCCRGGGETYNLGVSDANDLNASFLEKSRGDLTPVRDLIQQSIEANGWLIFATHDVAEQPSEFGCTPEFFTQVVKLAESSGAKIMPVGEAWRAIAKADMG